MKNLLECHGKEFIATIDDIPCRGKILVEEGSVYLCQNMIEGDSPENNNTLGFKYSWMIGIGIKDDLKYYDIENLQLVEELLPKEILYNEEEVRELCEKSFHAGSMYCSTEGKIYGQSENFDEWFESNREK